MIRIARNLIVGHIVTLTRAYIYMFVPVRVAYVKRVCFGAYATVPIKRVLYCIVLHCIQHFQTK